MSSNYESEESESQRGSVISEVHVINDRDSAKT